MSKKRFSISARMRSFGYAFNGIKLLIAEQHNAWIHLFAIACVTTAGIVMKIDNTEWITCVICFGLVLSAEAFNSAIETLCDKVSPENDTKIGKVKDIAAGAVLISALSTAAAGMIIFLPKIWYLLCN